MRPDDANIMGTVHGGTILKMIEEAGCVIGTRHCNTQNGVSDYNKGHRHEGKKKGSNITHTVVCIVEINSSIMIA